MTEPTWVERVCEHPECSDPFKVLASRLRLGYGRFCSKSCAVSSSRRKPKVAKTCESCGGTYEASPYNTASRFCSFTCATEAQKSRVSLVCDHCGGDFEVLANRSETARFCSVKCSQEYRKANGSPLNQQVMKTCEECGKPFRVSPAKADRRYCSQKCTGKAFSKDTERKERLARAFAQQLTSKGSTRPELVLYGLMDEAFGAEGWERQYPLHFWVVDAAVPAIKLVVQADGDFWHGRLAALSGKTPPPHVVASIRRDRHQDAHLSADGWTVLRLWESELLNDPEECLRRIRNTHSRLRQDEPPENGSRTA